MKVNRSAYYAYPKHLTYRESALKVACATRVKECFDFNRRRLRFTADRGEFENRMRHGAKGDAA